MTVEPMSRQGTKPALGLRLLTVLAALSTAALFIISIPVAAHASALRPLSVTLTFDDGFADELAAQQLLQQYGMRGTFYINSSFIGLPGYMTRAQLADVAAHGHEIGGHTVSHQPLTTLSADEQDRQICQDRNVLLSWGYAVTSFAYPFAEFSATTKTIAQHCGYNSARAVGDLRSPYSCSDCPATETIPPADRFEIRTPDDVESNWTLANLQNLVTRAETTGGWLPLNLHHVCSTGCPAESISPAVLGQFLNWLRPRSSPTIRTTVKTVQQALGGSVQPAVAAVPAPAPGAPGVNTVRNASLETAYAPDPNLPDCFNSAGYGANTTTQTRVTDAHSGTYASRITVSSRTDGDAKLLPRFDLGQCSSSVAQGRTYQASVWYKSDVQVFFTMYKRNALGQWSYWTQSPRMAPAGTWTQATWITPAPPADALAVSFGLTIDSVGTLTTDDYGFADTAVGPAPPGANALTNASLETDGADGFPQCWTGTGFGTNTPVWSRVTDAADGTYAEKLELTAWTDGDAKLIPSWDSANCAPLVTVGSTYTLALSYKSTATTFLTLYRQDAAGNWAYWTQSPYFPVSAAYTTATWTTPAVPAGTRAVTFGLTLDKVGEVTTDRYSMIAN
ncbi:polysaccharide deacetylase family protein [Actinoplanes sp. NPDC089786]|uniref:polysaccharide deacetylase family protein n=1 Tax=Actinoplanes sp. NPDC089786 TaxID=3155185 RepID=UPI00341E8BCC